MNFIDILLLVVSVLLIGIIVLQRSDEDATKAFTGEKSELFSSKKERGIEVWIKYITMGLSVAFFVLAIIASFMVVRFSI